MAQDLGDLLWVDETGIPFEGVLASKLERNDAVFCSVPLPGVSESGALESLQGAEITRLRNAMYK